MYRYIFNRLIGAVVTVWLVTTLVFLLVRLSGDPIALFADPYMSKDDVEALREELGIDAPVIQQYGIFVGNTLRGDFGLSLRFKEPALDLYLTRLPNTLKLMAVALVVSVGVGIPVGTLAGVGPNGLFDRTAKTLALFGQAVPSFWLGIMLILLFAVRLRWLPTSGDHGLVSLIMPGVTLGAASLAAMTRLTRSTVIDVRDTEFVRLLMVKGLPRRLVIWKHILHNASLPILTLASLTMVAFLSGSIVVEQIFSWPGVGRLAVEAVYSRDFPVIQTVVVVNTAVLVLVNLSIDLLYVVLDPRIRYTSAR
jgi:peptide/nickel transport system permease protein